MRIQNTFRLVVLIALGGVFSGCVEGGLDRTRRAAEDGDPKAQYALAVVYQQGQRVVKDVEEAARWYRAAALSCV